LGGDFNIASGFGAEIIDGGHNIAGNTGDVIVSGDYNQVK